MSEDQKPIKVKVDQATGRFLKKLVQEAEKKGLVSKANFRGSRVALDDSGVRLITPTNTYDVMLTKRGDIEFIPILNQPSVN